MNPNFNSDVFFIWLCTHGNVGLIESGVGQRSPENSGCLLCWRPATDEVIAKAISNSCCRSERKVASKGSPPQLSRTTSSSSSSTSIGCSASFSGDVARYYRLMSWQFSPAARRWQCPVFFRLFPSLFPISALTTRLDGGRSRWGCVSPAGLLARWSRGGR